MESDNGGGLMAIIFGGGMLVFMGVVMLIAIISSWKIYTKAGKPGWTCLVPFYNAWVMMEIIGFPGFYFLGMMVPVVGMFFALYCQFRLAKVFGKDVLYTVGLIFLPFIFYPLLAFGGDEYLGPEAAN